jgi:5-methylcytosine-specific restriction endonuclease McrA
MQDSLIELVWKRARNCCEYCQLPQALSSVRFEIDHIIAEQHAGESVASNLALACFADNHHKGPNLAGVDPQTRLKTWLYNPRRHKWSALFAGMALH